MECLLIFSNLYIQLFFMKMFQFMVLKVLENVLNISIFTHVLIPDSKLQVEVFENLFFS